MLKNAITLAITTAFLSATSSAAQRDCTFRRASVDFTTQTDFRPQYAVVAAQLHPQYDTNATLFRRGEPGVLITELAQSYDINNDKRILTVHLNKQCGWSDGHPVTAQHVKRGLELTFATQPGSYLPGRTMFKNGSKVLAGEANIESLGIRVIDDFTLEFDLEVPGELFLAALTYPSYTPAPLHLLKDNPTTWPTKSLLRKSSGAFKAVSITDTEIRMEQNPHYCRNIPISPKHVIIKKASTSSQFVPMFFGNEIDIAHGSPYEPRHFTAVQEQAVVPFEVEHRPAEMLGYLSLSKTKTWAQDKRIRHAMAITIDYDAIDRIVNPTQKSHNRLRRYSSAYPGYHVFPKDQRLQDYPILVQRAKKLMESAGYGPDARLRLKILYRGGHPSRSLTYALTAMYQQIYVDLEIDDISQDDRNFYAEIKANNYDLVIATWGSDYSDPSNFISGVLQSHYIPLKDMNVLKPALDATYNIFDKNTRFKKLAEIERMALDLEYVLPLYDQETVEIIRQGYHLGAEFRFSARNVTIDGCSRDTDLKVIENN